MSPTAFALFAALIVICNIQTWRIVKLEKETRRLRRAMPQGEQGRWDAPAQAATGVRFPLRQRSSKPS